MKVKRIKINHVIEAWHIETTIASMLEMGRDSNTVHEYVAKNILDCVRDIFKYQGSDYFIGRKSQPEVEACYDEAVHISKRLFPYFYQ
jgi:hypothetical protein